MCKSNAITNARLMAWSVIFGLVFFGFVFLTTSFFTSIFSISMGFLAATLEMGYFQFMFDIEKSSKTDLFLRFCVYLAISIGGLIVNFNFGFVLLLCALYGVLTVSGLTYGAISLGIMKASDAGEVEYGQAAASV